MWFENRIIDIIMERKKTLGGTHTRMIHVQAVRDALVGTGACTARAGQHHLDSIVVSPQTRVI